MKTATSVLMLAAMLLGGQVVAYASDDAPTPIIVELDALPPTVVAADQALRHGRGFDKRAHEQAVYGTQRVFLKKLDRAGIAYTVTDTPLQTAAGEVRKPNRFAHLINAIGLEVPDDAVEKIKAMPGVKHVTLDEPVQIHLDHSVEYVRASDGPGNKTIFTQGDGPPTRFDGTGQVIAILDTGIEHTHPTFDTRFSDADFLNRTGDVRPVRLAGQEYIEGTHHPKVVYFLPLTATTNEDDVGHGTHGASDAAGVKVKGPGLDRLPGTEDDQIIEGVAPGALLMNYKICETVFTCVGTVNIVTALEDTLSPTDPLGFSKPVATVINMSFGGTVGDPNSADAVAANNAALAGAVAVSSAGNAGPGENTVGSPAAGKRVIGVAATTDPGVLTHELDVLVPNPLRYSVGGMSTGAQNDAGRAVDAADRFMLALFMDGSPDVPFPLGQHYVYVGLADTPDQVPDEVNGRIGLAIRGSTVDAGATGTGLFGHKAAEVAAKGGVALLIFNNEEGELANTTAAATTIPVFGVSNANGLYLRDQLGFASAGFDPDDPETWGTLSNFPVRINPPDLPSFIPDATIFSSRGPIDNFQYLKPDITAPGQSIYGATIAAGGLHPSGSTMSDPSRFISASGTSFSGPHVAGGAALVRGALLSLYGRPPIEPAALRSGEGASIQLAQNEIVTQALVRSALTNTATNLRAVDNVSPLSDDDDRTYINAIGSGLMHVIEAVDVRAVMGTNASNGPSGPDDARDPDFLPTHSFGRNVTINTGEAVQTESVTVTIENASGVSGGGVYSLRLVDGGALRGNVTRPTVGTHGFDVGITPSVVTLSSAIGDRAAFEVTVNVDGRGSGLSIASVDVTGEPATEFLWWVVAEGENGEQLRMPFYYRAVAKGYPAPSQNPIQDDGEPDQVDGVDKDGNYVLSWTFPPPPAEQPCGFDVQEATNLTPVFLDDAEEPLLAGENSGWLGDVNWISNLHPDTMTLGYSPVYTDSQDISLTMKDPVTLSDVAARLVFDSFEDIENDFDYGYVEVSADGSGFQRIATLTGQFSGPRVIDLSSFAGKSVRIRFRFVSDQLISTPVHRGWFIDNIELQTADFATMATLGGSDFTYNVTGRTSGAYFYRVAGLFGASCDALGAYSNVEQIEVDSGPVTIAPTADLTASPNPAEVNETVTFDGSGSTDNDDVDCDPASDAHHCIVSYEWSFGDGATETTSAPVTQHAYAAPGTYRAMLTVTDNDGETGSAELLIEVVEPATGGSASGGGHIAASNGGSAHFAFDVSTNADGSVSGHLTYDDRNGHTKVRSESVDTLTIDGNQATFSGTCSVNKTSGFTFTVEAVDNGEPGSSDSLAISLSNGYETIGPLTGGNLQVHH